MRWFLTWTKLRIYVHLIVWNDFPKFEKNRIRQTILFLTPKFQKVSFWAYFRSCPRRPLLVKNSGVFLKTKLIMSNMCAKGQKRPKQALKWWKSKNPKKWIFWESSHVNFPIDFSNFWNFGFSPFKYLFIPFLTFGGQIRHN